MMKYHAVLILFSLLFVCVTVTAMTKCEDKDVYTLSVGDNTISISAQIGGRIVSYTCKGKELLLPSSVHDVNYGATLWPSPQSNWGWPPYAILDTDPYQASFDGEVLTLKSEPDPASGYLFEKRFSVSLADSAVNIEYSIRNISRQEKQVAAWDVCRTTGGLSFFPVGEDTKLPASSLKGISVEDGILWYNSNKELLPEAQKLFSTASEGWLAHFTNGLLFVKKFPDTKITELAPEQGEIEIFAQKEGLYIELENHGPYTILKPDENLTYREKWYLKEVVQPLTPVELARTVRAFVK